MSTLGWTVVASRGSVIAALGVTLGLVTVPATATAQLATAPAGAQVNADAQQLFADGQAAIKQKQWSRARTLLQGAWRIQQHWRIAAALGRAESMVGSRMRDVAEHLTFALRAVPAGKLSSDEEKQLAEMLVQARANVGAVKVSGTPSGAEVSVDGVLVGKMPLQAEIFLDPGTHRLAARREGYVEAERVVEAAPGKAAELDLSLTKVLVATPTGAGNGGGHEVEPVAAGPNKGMVVVGAVLAAAGLGIGIGLRAMSSAKATERDDLIANEPKRDNCVPQATTCLPAVSDADAAYASLARASTGSWLIAGGILAGTLTYALFPRSSKAEQPPKVMIVTGPGVAGLNISGAW